jgi:hypothetical protein
VTSNFRLARWRSERKRGTSARDWWPQPWQPHRRSLDKLVWVTAVWLKCRGMWHKTARCLTPARVDFKRWGQSGHDGRTNNPLSSSRVEIFSPRNVIRAPLSKNHLVGVNPGVGVTGGQVHCTYDLVQSTIPSGLLSGCLTEHNLGRFPPNSMWQLANLSVTKL